MKNLIVNIYKTLFFFDLAIIVAYYIPEIKTENTAVLNLWREGVFLAVTILFTAFFLKFVEHGKLRVFNLKNKLRHYSIGLLTAVIPLGVTVLILWLFKAFTFSGMNQTGSIVLWLLAILFNAAATELLLRGYLYRLYRKFYSLPTVTVVITLLFISLNIDMFSKGVIYTLNMLLMNILLCLTAEYSYSLLAPVTAHFIYNAASSFVLGSFSLSDEYPALFNTASAVNKYFSGGDLKLEGSAVMLLMNIALCAFFIVRLKKRQKQSLNRRGKRKSPYR